MRKLNLSRDYCALTWGEKTDRNKTTTRNQGSRWSDCVVRKVVSFLGRLLMISHTFVCLNTQSGVCKHIGANACGGHRTTSRVLPWFLHWCGACLLSPMGNCFYLPRLGSAVRTTLPGFFNVGSENETWLPNLYGARYWPSYLPRLGIYFLRKKNNQSE